MAEPDLMSCVTLMIHTTGAGRIRASETPSREGGAAVMEKAPERVRKPSPRYKVLLHNDPVNTMEYVVTTLRQVVPSLSEQDALAVMLEALDGLYRERPFGVFMADCGAYRLPLLRAVHQRYGIPSLSSGRPMATWLKG
jgi:hypothetical protein